MTDGETKHKQNWSYLKSVNKASIGVLLLPVFICDGESVLQNTYPCVEHMTASSPQDG